MKVKITIVVFALLSIVMFFFFNIKYPYKEKDQDHPLENEEVIEFRADKPFTYYILDDSGNVYFAGRYVKAE